MAQAENPIRDVLLDRIRDEFMELNVHLQFECRFSSIRLHYLPLPLALPLSPLVHLDSSLISNISYIYLILFIFIFVDNYPHLIAPMQPLSPSPFLVEFIVTQILTSFFPDTKSNIALMMMMIAYKQSTKHNSLPT